MIVDVPGQQANDEVQHDVDDQADVSGQQRTRGGRDQEQQRGHEQHVRHHHYAECPGITVPAGRAQSLRIDPRHHAADRHTQRAGQHDRQRRQIAGHEAAAEISATAHRCGEKQLRSALVEIAQRRTGDEDRHQEDAEDGEHTEQPDDHHRGIAQYIAAGTADDHRVGADQSKRERTEYGGDDPEQRCLQLLAQLESADLEKCGLEEHRYSRPRYRKKLASVRRPSLSPARAGGRSRRLPDRV